MILPYRELATDRDAGCDDGRGDGVVTAAGALSDGLAGTDVAGEPHATKRTPRPTNNRGRMIAAAYRSFVSGLLRQQLAA